VADPREILAPDNTGSANEKRSTFQANLALYSVLRMLAGLDVLHVTCEHTEDVVVARDPRHRYRVVGFPAGQVSRIRRALDAVRDRRQQGPEKPASKQTGYYCGPQRKGSGSTTGGLLTCVFVGARP